MPGVDPLGELPEEKRSFWRGMIAGYSRNLGADRTRPRYSGVSEFVNPQAIAELQGSAGPALDAADENLRYYLGPHGYDALQRAGTIGQFVLDAPSAIVDSAAQARQAFEQAEGGEYLPAGLSLANSLLSAAGVLPFVAHTPADVTKGAQKTITQHGSAGKTYDEILGSAYQEHSIEHEYYTTGPGSTTPDAAQKAQYHQDVMKELIGMSEKEAVDEAHVPVGDAPPIPNDYHAGAQALITQGTDEGKSQWDALLGAYNDAFETYVYYSTGPGKAMPGSQEAADYYGGVYDELVKMYYAHVGDAPTPQSAMPQPSEGALAPKAHPSSSLNAEMPNIEMGQREAQPLPQTYEEFGSLMNEARGLAGPGEPIYPILAYRGSRSDIREYNPAAFGKGMGHEDEPAFWFSNDPGTAEAFARMTHGGQPGQSVYPSRLRLEDPYISDMQFYDRDQMVRVLQEAKEAGHDSVIFPWLNEFSGNPNVANNAGQIAVFDPERIRSHYARFDPHKINSRDILASALLATLLGHQVMSDRGGRENAEQER